MLRHLWMAFGAGGALGSSGANGAYRPIGANRPRFAFGAPRPVEPSCPLRGDRLNGPIAAFCPCRPLRAFRPFLNPFDPSVAFEPPYGVQADVSYP